MATNKDWLPKNRTDILSMARTWHEVMDTNKTPWNISQNVVQDFEISVMEAESALNTAKNEATRTPVATAQCKAAFDTLITKMRDCKRRFFLIPPLTDPDLVSLGLKIPDRTPTPSGTPTAQATVETYLVGRHELGVKIIYVAGSPTDPANKGYHVWYSVIAQGDTPPATPDDLRKTFYTKRKKDIIEFDFADSGKTAFFAVQIDNEGKKGPWGPLVQALIP